MAAQVYRIGLPKQETWVHSLVQKDPTRSKACAPQLLSLRSRARVHNKRSCQSVKPAHCLHNYRKTMWQRRPSTAKDKQIIFKKMIEELTFCILFIAMYSSFYCPYFLYFRNVFQVQGNLKNFLCFLLEVLQFLSLQVGL